MLRQFSGKTPFFKAGRKYEIIQKCPKQTAGCPEAAMNGGLGATKAEKKRNMQDIKRCSRGF
jgi:hypothetical protein